MKTIYRKTFIIFFLCFNFSLLNAQDILIKGGYYFDEKTGTMIKNSGILVVSGKIASVNDNSDKPVVNILQLNDFDYILPGIIDMHAHFKVHIDGREKEDTTSLPKIYLANGVTSTFTAGELEPMKILALKGQINSGERIGPRIFNTGPYFGKDANSINKSWHQNMSEDEIISLINLWVSRGIDGIKVKGVTKAQLKIIIEKAHTHGLTVTGHLDSGFGETVSTVEAIELGIDRVEHFLGGEIIPDSIGAYQALSTANAWDKRLDPIINTYIARHIYYSPTISAYGMVGGSTDLALKDWIDQRKFFTDYAKSIIARQSKRLPFNITLSKIYEFKKVEIKRFYDAGGKDLIVLGTDRQLRNGDIGGFAVHKEMQVLSASGISNADVIRIASINGAKALGKSDYLGSIEIGKWADLYIITGNPLDDISTTNTVHTVIKAGKVYSTNKLLNSVLSKLGPINNADWKD